MINTVEKLSGGDILSHIENQNSHNTQEHENSGAAIIDGIHEEKTIGHEAHDHHEHTHEGHHTHSHSHDHHSHSYKNILVAFLLNLSFAILEAVGGVLTGSVAILSDSIHDLGDAIVIGISYFLEKKSKKAADAHDEVNAKKYSLIGAGITTGVLIVGSVIMIISAINRIAHPVE
ncbi:MAG: cation transporter, partial [Bacteroidales bacterium]|nr:cation transporter [Bacteroidales bacterium]